MQFSNFKPAVMTAVALSTLLALGACGKKVEDTGATTTTPPAVIVTPPVTDVTPPATTVPSTTSMDSSTMSSPSSTMSSPTMSDTAPMGTPAASGMAGNRPAASDPSK